MKVRRGTEEDKVVVEKEEEHLIDEADNIAVDDGLQSVCDHDYGRAEELSSDCPLDCSVRLKVYISCRLI